jgi:heavy metal sensor kinase
MSRWATRLPIRTRLTLWYSAILLGIVLVMSVFTYFMLRGDLIAELDVELTMIAQLVRDTGPGPAERSTAELRDLRGRTFNEVFFRVVGPDGQAEAGSETGASRRLSFSSEARARRRSDGPTFETVTSNRHERLRLLTLPLMPGAGPQRFLQVAVSFDDIDRTLTSYLETLAIVLPLGLGLSATGGAWVARSALRPVQTMSRTARRVTAEDLSRRLALRGTGDELDDLAETLNAMLARLEEAFDHARRFAADAAHELRTPLTALKGGIEVTLRADRAPETYREVLRSSLEDVDRVVRLAEGLLLLSRVRMGEPGPPHPVAVEPLVLEVLEMARRLAEGRDVGVQLGHVEPLTVRGDRASLWRAVLNLIENAIKYTPAGGKVEIAVERDGAHALVQVRDTGVGMDAVDIERIFEPFVRLESAPAHETGGAGLGLAIVRAIVTAHGGTLSVQSTRGAGSTFTIRLPLG